MLPRTPFNVEDEFGRKARLCHCQVTMALCAVWVTIRGWLVR